MIAFRFVHTGAGRFFDHRQNLVWFHVQYFCDASLHDQEIRIVDVQLNGTEEIGNFFVQYNFTVDQVFVFAADDNLPGYRYFAAFFVANWTLIRIGIVEYNSDGGFCDASLAAFENQFLQ